MINAFLGHNIGFLNPSLYTFGPQICNDITFGDNDSSYIPDAPFYTADIGWDPCTGWGSLNGIRLLAALAPAPIIEAAIPNRGFADTCVGQFSDMTLSINNAGFLPLLISNITAAPADFLAPSVTSYPLAVAPGDSIDVVIQFQAGSLGFKSGTITILSNSLFGPLTINVTGTAQAPRLVTAIADRGNFGRVCVGSFRDESLILNNSGKCTLSITGIAATGDFLAPHVVHFPIAIGPGDALPLPIRFEPTAFGLRLGTITVSSDDPAGPQTIPVSGDVPSGKLAVTGSTCFGGVPACCCRERTISICNTGDCSLHVTSVAYKRANRHWKLIHNPFPGTLHPGSCLGLVIRYLATEKCPRACELVITSDDPSTPVKTLDLMAYTIWNRCGCKKCCEDCQKGCCQKSHADGCCCQQRADSCCDEDALVNDGDE
jgi:hypothetical protein